MKKRKRLSDLNLTEDKILTRDQLKNILGATGSACPDGYCYNQEQNNCVVCTSGPIKHCNFVCISSPSNPENPPEYGGFTGTCTTLTNCPEITCIEGYPSFVVWCA
jgi:hypothetical protein